MDRDRETTLASKRVRDRGDGEGQKREKGTNASKFAGDQEIWSEFGRKGKAEGGEPPLATRLEEGKALFSVDDRLGLRPKPRPGYAYISRLSIAPACEYASS